MPIEIISPIPAEILPSGGGGGSYVLSSDAFDVAIDGMPFLLSVNDDRPYIREVQSIGSPKFDNFSEPGEYSMIEWWLRSQSDWGGGMGATYQDPGVDARSNIKFNNSTGINSWKPGEISLLPAPVETQDAVILAESVSLARGYFGGFQSLPRAWFSVDEKLYSYDVKTGVITNILYSGADPEQEITGLTSFGNKYYVANVTGIYTGTGAGAGTKIWNTGSDTVIEWVKGRLMAGIGNKVYELVGAGPALPAAKFTHLDAAWRWTSIAEGPTAIYLSGGDYPDNAIYKFVLGTDGAVPTLASGGTVAALMPPGEEINTIYCYLGTFMGIATNRGFRVGLVDQQGDITYGPLLWERSSGFIMGDDRFFYVGVTGGIDLDPDRIEPPPVTFPGVEIQDQYICDGVYRVDLGQELQASEGSSLRYAYSTDRFLAIPNEAIDPVEGNQKLSALCQIGDRFLFGIYRAGPGGDDGSAALWPTDREEEERIFPPLTLITATYPKVLLGWIQTGRVRFNTQEPKLFRFFSTRSPLPLLGDIDVDLIDDSQTVTRYITYTPARPPDVGDIPLSSISTPKSYVSLRFTLHRGEAFQHEGAILNGWQLKALPAPIRQRVFTMSLSCFDMEMDKTGQGIGYEGYALERLLALEQSAQRGNVLSLQELYNDMVYQVTIDQMQFAQMGPPGPTTSSVGGYITLRLKTVSDVIG